MARNRTEMPQDESAKTAHIGAKVSLETFHIVDHAAQIRGWPRSRIVEEGAVLRAQQIIEQAGANLAALRRMTRQSRSRQGGLARARKK